jgi:erythromycin esterase
MKTLLALLTALPLLCAAAEPPLVAGVQQWPLRAAPEHPADVDDDFADLTPLGDKLAKAQVVALGEQTHGGSEESRYKLRLLRYLHEKLGFDVLLLESGFYDMGRLSQAMSRGQSLDALAPGNVFYMYANSAEGRELLRYVDQQRRTRNPLALAGIDSQHSGNLARTEMLADLQTALGRIAPELLNDEAAWADYQQRVLALVALDRQPPPAAQRSRFLAFNQRLQDAFCGDRSEPSLGGPAWWCRVTASIEAQARSLWSNDRDYQRDNAMGANAVWLVDQLFRGHKAVVWAHTGHLAKGLQRSAEQLQAGEIMNRRWGTSYQVVNFTALSGSYLDYVDLKEKPVPAPPAGSLEARLPAQTLLLKANSPLTLPQYGVDYSVTGLPVPARLGQHWDWLIALPSVTPVKMTR